jgi:hypothetical protein
MFRTAGAGPAPRVRARKRSRSSLWRGGNRSRSVRWRDEVVMGMKLSVGVAVAVAVGAPAWPPSAAYQFVASTVVCTIAIVAALQAHRTHHNLWLFGLAAIAVLFNPVVPIVLPRTVMLWASAGCLTAIAAWLMFLQRTVPARPVAQVIDPPEAAQ